MEEVNQVTPRTLLFAAAATVLFAVTRAIELPFQSCEIRCPFSEFAGHGAATIAIAFTAVLMVAFSDRAGWRYSREFRLQMLVAALLFAWSIGYFIRPLPWD